MFKKKGILGTILGSDESAKEKLSTVFAQVITTAEKTADDVVKGVENIGRAVDETVGKVEAKAERANKRVNNFFEKVGRKVEEIRNPSVATKTKTAEAAPAATELKHEYVVIEETQEQPQQPVKAKPAKKKTAKTAKTTKK